MRILTAINQSFPTRGNMPQTSGVFPKRAQSVVSLRRVCKRCFWVILTAERKPVLATDEHRWTRILYSAFREDGGYEAEGGTRAILICGGSMAKAERYLRLRL
jgi:hypothetical protein